MCISSLADVAQLLARQPHLVRCKLREITIFCDPNYDPIRDDRRFGKAFATLGFTEAHARAQAWRAAHPPEKPAVH